MWHKPCRTFHPWCPCIKTRCLCTSYGQHLQTYRYMQKSTRLNLMHRYESYEFAQQLMPWLHRTPGHPVVILLIMKIDSEETPLWFTTHFLQFIWHNVFVFLQKYLHCLSYSTFWSSYKICATMNVVIIKFRYLQHVIFDWYLAKILPYGLCSYIYIYIYENLVQWQRVQRCKCQYSSYQY